MIRWARKSDVLSDWFVAFCRESGISDPHHNVNRLWEYPWSFSHGGLTGELRVLDVGTGPSTFPLIVRERTKCRITLLDPDYVKGVPDHLMGFPIVARRIENAEVSKGSFDRIFCISVIEHMSEEAQDAAILAMARLLAPGGRLIMTIDHFIDWPRWVEYRDVKPRVRHWLPGADNVDIGHLIVRSGLALLGPGEDPTEFGAPPTDEEWASRHINGELKVTSIGVVLWRPFTRESADDSKFRLSNHVALTSGHIELDGAQGAEAYFLPSREFSYRDLLTAYDQDEGASLNTLNRLARDCLVARV